MNQFKSLFSLVLCFIYQSITNSLVHNIFSDYNMSVFFLNNNALTPCQHHFIEPSLFLILLSVNCTTPYHQYYLFIANDLDSIPIFAAVLPILVYVLQYIMVDYDITLTEFILLSIYMTDLCYSSYLMLLNFIDFAFEFSCTARHFPPIICYVFIW